MSDTVKLIIEIPKAEYERLVYIDSLKLRGYVENGKPLDDVLGEIRAEIEQLHHHPILDFINTDKVVDMALEIIDKYKTGSEG